MASWTVYLLNGTTFKVEADRIQFGNGYVNFSNGPALGDTVVAYAPSTAAVVQDAPTKRKAAPDA